MSKAVSLIFNESFLVNSEIKAPSPTLGSSIEIELLSLKNDNTF